MDIRSIVRVFRFNEMTSRAERDPEARRPPTIKFMGVALLLGLLLVLISFWSAPETETSGAIPLAVESNPADSPNATTPQGPSEQQPPAPAPGSSDADEAARPQDGP